MEAYVLALVAIMLAVVGALLHAFTPPKEGALELVGKIVAGVVVTLLYLPVLMAYVPPDTDLLTAIVVLAPGVITSAYYAMDALNAFLDRYKPPG